MADNAKDEEGTPGEKGRSKVRHSVETLGGIIAESAKIYREIRSARHRPRRFNSYKHKDIRDKGTRSQPIKTVEGAEPSSFAGIY